MYEKIKRTFDIIFSLSSLIFLAPLFLFIYLVLLFTSGRPVFFKQIRKGLLGKKFKLYKFRTMRKNLSSNNLSLTVEDDIRITTVGKYLRKLKLDELPQIVNILLGDMSFVGPRPEVPIYYSNIPSSYKRFIQKIRPGLTDFATLHYINESSLLLKATDPEAFYRKKILPNKTRLQYFYFVKRSFLIDLIILLKTLIAIIRLNKKK